MQGSLTQIERLMADAARARAQAEMLRERLQTLLNAFREEQSRFRETATEFFRPRHESGHSRK